VSFRESGRAQLGDTGREVIHRKGKVSGKSVCKTAEALTSLCKEKGNSKNLENITKGTPVKIGELPERNLLGVEVSSGGRESRRRRFGERKG